MKRSKSGNNKHAVPPSTGFTPSLKQSLLALAIAQSLSAGAVQAATIHVGGPDGQGCGLSAAILSANNDVSHPGSNCTAGSGDDVIELNRSVTRSTSWFDDDNGVRTNTYTSMPLITSTLTINGNGNTLARSSSASEVFGLLNTQANLTINNLTLSGGDGSQNRGQGAAVNTESDYLDLYLNGVAIENNSGGASVVASNRGNFTIVDTSISNNDGDGVYLSGRLDKVNIENTTISNNSGVGVRNAFYLRYESIYITNSSIDNNINGGIYKGYAVSGSSATNKVVIQSSSISGNGNTGIALSTYNLEVIDSVIDGNSARNCAGMSFNSNVAGGTTNPTVTITNSTVSNNSAERIGGGVCLNEQTTYYFYGYGISSPSINIVDSTFSGNVAGTYGGALVLRGDGIEGTQGTCADRGLLITHRSHTITNSTISGNSAGVSGGGIYMNGRAYVDRTPAYCFGFISSSRSATQRTKTLILENTTISGNEAGTNGGGLDIAEAELNLSNSIIAGNTALISDSEISFDGEVLNFYGVVDPDLSDPIIGGNSLLGSLATSNVQAFSADVPSGINIIATVDGNNPTALDSIISPLQDNGGTTLTHALVAGSPAVGAGDLDACVNDPVGGVDQRGETRGADGVCDIGAYEEQGGLNGFSVTAVNALEGDKVVFTIMLDEPQPAIIGYDFSTEAGTAIDGEDYVGRVGRLLFPVGETVLKRRIEVLEDSVPNEGDETFSMVVTDINNPSLTVTTQATIQDSDNLPLISVDVVKTRENSGSAVVTIVLSEPSTDVVLVDFSTVIPKGQFNPATGGEDYVERTGRITFAPGVTEQTRRITLIDDNLKEANEVFRFELSKPRNAQIAVGSELQRVFILNDD